MRRLIIILSLVLIGNILFAQLKPKNTKDYASRPSFNDDASVKGSFGIGDSAYIDKFFLQSRPRFSFAGSISLGSSDSLFLGGDTATGLVDIDDYNFTKIGVGVASNLATNHIQIYEPLVAFSGIRFNNGFTGSLVTDGGSIGESATGTLNVTNAEANDILFTMGGLTKLTLDYSGSHTLTGFLTVTGSSATSIPLWGQNDYATSEGGYGLYLQTTTASTNTNSTAKSVAFFRRISSGTTTAGFGGNNSYSLKIGTTNIVTNIHGWSWYNTSAAYKTKQYFANNNNGTCDTMLVGDIEGIYIGQNKTTKYLYADSGWYNSGSVDKGEYFATVANNASIILPTNKTGFIEFLSDSNSAIKKYALVIFTPTTTYIQSEYGTDTGLTSDAGTGIAFFTSGTKVYIKNRTGWNRNMLIKVIYH